MKFQVFNRKFHYWAAIAIALPSLIIITTGLFLQMKKNSSWVQPPELKGSGKVPVVSFDQVLEACRAIPQAQIQDWENVNRIDVRPGRGMLKVTAKNNWEIQIDTKTGEVLQVAYRRSDIIESIHDGSWFHDKAKLLIFLPTGVALLLLWLTGMYLFALPILARRRRQRLGARQQQPVRGIG